MPIHGQVIRYGLRAGLKYFPKTLQAVKRADVAIHKSLYGASAGRGVRHGRDIGTLVASGIIGFSGDDLDEFSEREDVRSPPRKKLQAYRRYKRFDYKRRKCYRPRYFKR